MRVNFTLFVMPKSLYISRLVSYFYETEFEIWAGFGPAWQLRLHEFFVLLTTILSRFYFRLLKQARIIFF